MQRFIDDTYDAFVKVVEEGRANKETAQKKMRGLLSRNGRITPMDAFSPAKKRINTAWWISLGTLMMP